MTEIVNNNNNNSNIKTYRHEFSKGFMADLSEFSKVHQFDDRHTYKKEWIKWSQRENIAEAIEMEKRRLEENGYNGDIDDKMFKAGRYYFRKKNVAATSTTTTPTTTTTTPTSAASNESSGVADNTVGVVPSPPPPQSSVPDLPTTPTTTISRRPYITMSKTCIKMMDDHIRNASSSTSTEFKPSSCYDDFYQTKMASTEMTKELDYIIEKYEKTPNAMSNISPDELTNQIMDKIKKTYKNRYYKFISSSSAASAKI
jgi:hypothetical protein